MRFWVGVTAAFSAGTLIGIGLGQILLEDKLQKQYEESSASMRRAYEALKIDAETPVHTEEELDTPIQLSTPLGEGSVQITPTKVDPVAIEHESVEGVKENPYHVALAVSSPEIYASYAQLEEEDYYEDDGRVKDQITMIFDDGVARFFSAGEEIDDAFDRVGGTIVDDMRESVRNGNPILYIRNNKTEVDYEVTFEQP